MGELTFLFKQNTLLDYLKKNCQIAHKKYRANWQRQSLILQSTWGLVSLLKLRKYIIIYYI